MNMLEKTMVIKSGSRTNVKNGDLNKPFITRLCSDIATKSKEGYYIILVVSGAVPIGMKEYGFDKKPQDIKDLQMCSAYGQGPLFRAYQKGLKEHNLRAVQILLTYPELNNVQQNIYIESELEHCLINRSIPTINYNDPVDRSEARKDNDELALRVAIDSSAGEIVLITDVDGLYDGKRLIKELKDPLNYLHLCNGKNDETTGGMESKLHTAARAREKNIKTYIGNYIYPLDKILRCDPSTVVIPIGE